MFSDFGFIRQKKINGDPDVNNDEERNASLLVYAPSYISTNYQCN